MSSCEKGRFRNVSHCYYFVLLLQKGVIADILAKSVENHLQHQHGSRTSQDVERLTGKQGEQHTHHGGCKDALHRTLHHAKQNTAL